MEGDHQTPSPPEPMDSFDSTIHLPSPPSMDPVVKKLRTPAKRKKASHRPKPLDVLPRLHALTPSTTVAASTSNSAAAPSTPPEVPTGGSTTPAPKPGKRQQPTGKKNKRRQAQVPSYVEALSQPWPTRWSDLPAAALSGVALRLFESPSDVGAFSAVCRGWGSAAGEAKRAAFSSGRPLLLLPPSPSHDGCRFYRLPVAAGGRVYGGRRTIGFSHEHLVVFDDGAHRPLLVSLSDGKETWFPRTAAHTYSYYGFLTARPAASSAMETACVLVLFCLPEGGLQHCRLGEERWSLHQFVSAGWFFAAAAMLGDMVYALSNRGHLMAMDLLGPRRHQHGGSSSAPFRLEEEHVKVKDFPEGFPHGSVPPMLVTRSGGEVLLIHVGVKTEFYRLEWSEMRWAKAEGLGDGAVRVSHHGSPVCFVPPAWWRVRQDALQLRRSGDNGVQTEMPLEGALVDGVPAKPEWPSPVWILLSM